MTSTPSRPSAAEWTSNPSLAQHGFDKVAYVFVVFNYDGDS